MSTQSDAVAFLGALFPDLDEGRRILVWTIDRSVKDPKKRPKISYWPASAQDAATVAMQHGGDKSATLDVYVGVGLSPKSYGPRKRVPKASVAGIVALWADVDWAHGVHKKEDRLPPTRSDALDLVKAMPLAPSIVVDSGHGLQPWWLLHEPLIFADAKERDHAAAIAAGWEDLLRSKAAARGWTVDSVHDLSRILRVPGTWNRKGPDDTIAANPKPVHLLELHDSRRYDLDEFAQYLAPTTAKTKARTQTEVVAISDGFTVAAGSAPPFQKFQAMLDNVDQFAKTWNRERKDFADQSASSYDLSLANQVVRAGWTDQEIVDLLIAFREKHSDPPKLRADYYARTLAKARSALDREDAMERIDELANSPDAQAIPKDERRRQALASLSTVFGFRVNRMTKTIATRPEYHIWTEFGDYAVGYIAQVTRMASFRDALADATGRWIVVAKNEWPTIVQTLLDATEELDVGEEATIEGSARAWLRSYLERTPPGSDPHHCITTRMPFIKDGELYVFLEPVRRHVRTVYGDNVTARDLGKAIRHAGGQSRVVRHQGTSRQSWSFPADLVGELVPDDDMPDSGVGE